jgi:nitroreductase
MTFMELAEARYSVRKFSDKPVEKEKLDAVLEAARVAPTAHNFQPFRIYVLKSSEAIAKIRKLTPCAFNAPVVLMVTVAEEEQWTNDLEKGFAAGQVDVGIIGTHLMLEAAEQGLGSCWVAHFPPRSTAEAFGLSRHETPIMLLPLGYPADGVVPSPSHALRKSLGELVKEF